MLEGPGDREQAQACGETTPAPGGTRAAERQRGNAPGHWPSGRWSASGRTATRPPPPAPRAPSVRPHAARGRTGGRGSRPQRQALRCRSGPGDVQAPPAGPSWRTPKVFVGSSEALQRRGQQGVKHCKGDRVPTLRPLLAVTGPPRQSGRSPVPWPCRAVLQRVHPVHREPTRARHLVRTSRLHLVRTSVKVVHRLEWRLTRRGAPLGDLCRGPPVANRA